MPAQVSLEPARDVAIARTPSSWRWVQHLPVPLEAGQRSVTLSARARQDCQDAFVQEASWMVIDCPSISLRVHAKLAPRVSDGSGTRWSPSYRSIVVLRAEANITRVILNKSKAINHKEM
jgi:hypothetical protein